MRPILILLPSIRPHLVGDSIASFARNGTNLYDLLVLSGPGGYAAVVNNVPRQLLMQYEIVGLMGDDIRMRTPGWDKLVYDKMHGKILQLWGQDGMFNDQIPTHPFISSKVFLALGFIILPTIHHYHGDMVLKDVMWGAGRQEYCPELYTEHVHYMCGKSENDAVYQENMKWWDRDMEALHEFKNRDLSSMIDRIKNLTP